MFMEIILLLLLLLMLEFELLIRFTGERLLRGGELNGEEDGRDDQLI